MPIKHVKDKFLLVCINKHVPLDTMVPIDQKHVLLRSYACKVCGYFELYLLEDDLKRIQSDAD